MGRVWLQKARYNAITNKVDPRIKKLLDRVLMGQPYECNPDGTPATKDRNGNLTSAGGYLGHDHHSISKQDEYFFKVLRDATAAELNTASTVLDNAIKNNTHNEDLKPTIRAALKSKMDALQAADAVPK